MLRRQNHSRLLLTSAIMLVITGCFSTDIPPIEPPSGLEKLVHLSDSVLPLRIKTADFQNRSVGHQYLLLALPLTRIYLPNLEADLKMQLSVACGMRGYRCTDQVSTPSERLLELTVRDVTVDGYDLIFVRKPTASVTLSARILENGEVLRSCEESYVATNTAHYAFSTELQNALGEALLQGSYKILDCLGLTGRGS